MRFTPGLELCRLFFEECVRPILSEEFPGLRYAAAQSRLAGWPVPAMAER